MATRSSWGTSALRTSPPLLPPSSTKARTEGEAASTSASARRALNQSETSRARPSAMAVTRACQFASTTWRSLSIWYQMNVETSAVPRKKAAR